MKLQHRHRLLTAAGAAVLVASVATAAPASAVPDRTPPKVTVTLSAAPNADGWHAAPLRVDIDLYDDQALDLPSSSIALTGAHEGTEVPEEHNFYPIARDGVTTLSWTVLDMAGHVTTGSTTVRLDTVAPDLDVVNPDGQVVGVGIRRVVDTQAGDSASGVASTRFSGDVSADGVIDSSSLGDHGYTVTATDRAGNTSTVTRHFTVVPVYAPQVYVQVDRSSGNAGWFSAPVDVTLHAEAFTRGAKVTEIQVRRDGGPVETVPNDSVFHLSADGVHTFAVEAIDSNGTAAPSDTGTVQVDQSGPTISVPLPRVVEQGAEVFVNYSCQDALSHVWNCEAHDRSGRWTNLLETDTLGAHTFTVEASDWAGNGSRADVTYVVAPEPVTLTLSGSATVTEGTPVRVTASAQWTKEPFRGIVSLFDGSTRLSDTTWDPTTQPLTIDVGTLALGTHTLTAELSAPGRARRTFEPLVVQVVPATTPPPPAPQPVRTATTASYRVKHRRVTAGVTVTGGGTGRVTVYDGRQTLVVGEVVQGKVTIRLPRLSRGLHRLSVAYAGSTTTLPSRSAVTKVRIR